MGSYMIMSLFFAFLSMNIVVVYGAQLTPRHYDLYIYEVNITKLCNTTVTLTANGTVPGPTIHANKGETVYVTVHNNGTHGITIHWHGILQPRNPWSDGPLNITQCPIRPNSTFTYELIFSREEGTIWYHAHSEWSMATVHGAIVIKPEHEYPYPILPYSEQEIILGSWYIQEVMKMYETARANGNAFPPANATTINGQPGYPNNCSTATSFKMTVEYNKTYLLRVVNAVLNEDQFFGIAGHNLTLVGHDGAYTKPLTSDYIRIAPGQTMDVLFTANQTPGCYFMAAAPYFSGGNVGAFTNTTTSAILRYRGSCAVIIDPTTIPYPTLPAIANTTAAAAFTNAIRSLNSRKHPVVVPKTITKNVTIVASVGNIGGVPSAALNGISFVFPNISVLQAYSQNISGYFEEDFPSQTADIPAVMEHGTKALMFNYSDEVQIVFSGGVHPMHIHGFSFYAVANGTGTFVADDVSDCTETTDPTAPCYNLVDPPELNTVSIPAGGWVAIRFVANNPGVWFVHCHYERHLSEGMSTVFIVKNGTTEAESMLPTPDYMPPCTCTEETCLSSSAPIKEKGLFRPFASI